MAKWKEVYGFPGYEVSELGNVCRVVFGQRKILKIGTFNHGYKRVCMANDSGQHYRLLHRVVLEAFIGPCPKGQEACHNDGNKENNQITNLRWDTHSNNQLDKALHGTLPLGSDVPISVLSVEDVLSIKSLFLHNFSNAQIGRFYGVHRETIRAIRMGKTWAWLSTDKEVSHQM